MIPMDLSTGWKLHRIFFAIEDGIRRGHRRKSEDREVTEMGF
jgi:hypothetical protein